MKLALFRTEGKYPVTVVLEQGPHKYSDMIRLSEFVEVDFPRRVPSEVAAEQASQLDAEAAELHAKLDKLAARKAELEVAS